MLSWQSIYSGLALPGQNPKKIREERKMKKRLLALALCFVLAVSVLPITAAADNYYLTSVTIKASGVKQLSDGKYYVIVTSAIGTYDGGEIDITSRLLHMDGNLCGDLLDSNQQKITTPPEEQTTYLAAFPFYALRSTDSNDVYLKDASIPVKLDIPGYAIGSCLFDYSREYFNCYINITKEHEHTWQFTQTDSTLTATCKNCDTPPVTLTLSAHSVTLPNSPFNARLEGLEQFKKEVPSAVIGDFVYKYKGSGDSEYRVVTPTAANAKAGEYQVGVRISGLPNKEYGPVEMSLDDEVIPDGAGYADLYVKYTAVDPAVTAQTGDNRPIELMMASVLVFSALAAAAFILDNKRKYSR